MEGPQHLIEPFWFHFLNPRVGLIGDAEAQQVGMPQVGELLDRLGLPLTTSVLSACTVPWPARDRAPAR